jgi:hypothetical protein
MHALECWNGAVAVVQECMRYASQIPRENLTMICVDAYLFSLCYPLELSWVTHLPRKNQRSPAISYKHAHACVNMENACINYAFSSETTNTGEFLSYLLSSDRRWEHRLSSKPAAHDNQVT